MLWDSIRSQWVPHTPEEEVRQRLIHHMTQLLGFPKGLISVEKGIENGRRCDLLCYTQKMVPLLLVECKAGELNEAAIQQALGYNSTVKAPFICVANPKDLKLIWEERGEIVSLPFLPRYDQLISKI